ncbi:hypothetical protein TNCV_1571731 [Trichonephila clavipes]|uniref:Uncharacterized protein n=1 Tax=Trichonephila clavipes TaxID=2585209 RepID=A0A8X6SKF7_TRICX|nr:hypothetical protein TNCV_1571731 [Trichonephila clavipes]
MAPRKWKLGSCIIKALHNWNVNVEKLTHAQFAEERVAADWRAPDYLNTKRWQTDVVTSNRTVSGLNGHLALVFLSFMNAYRLCMVKKSCLIKRLVAGAACAITECGGWSQMGIPPYPQTKTTLLEYRR